MRRLLDFIQGACEDGSIVGLSICAVGVFFAVVYIWRHA